ncbi:MAG: aminopeptidase [Erysipelotrichaceae bacterium]
MFKRISKYADLLINLGVRLQKDQYLIIEGSVDCADLIRELTISAFKAKAKDVIVFYTDPYVDKERISNLSVADISTVVAWQKESREYYLSKGAATILIKSAYPYLYENVAEEKTSALLAFTNELRNTIRESIASRGTHWNICSYPNKHWAKVLYSDLPEQEAYNKMLDLMMSICRVDFTNDTFADWQDHFKNLGKYRSYLNSIDIDYLHFKNSLKTDLKVGLHPDSFFSGGINNDEEISFIANIPTEEIFSAPDKYRVDGVVYATKPLELGGAIVEDFYLKFEKGKVVEVVAEKNAEVLKNMINTDEGSCYLGEVALVENKSPISSSDKLFYNTLYDENASCHLALGKAYALVKGAKASDTSNWDDFNLNVSKIHVDFMFGSADLEVVAYDRKGKAYPIFKDGNFSEDIK